MSKIVDLLLYAILLAMVLMIINTWKEARETNRFIEQILEIAKEPRP